MLSPPLFRFPSAIMFVCIYHVSRKRLTEREIYIYEFLGSIERQHGIHESFSFFFFFKKALGRRGYVPHSAFTTLRGLFPFFLCVFPSLLFVFLFKIDCRSTNKASLLRRGQITPDTEERNARKRGNELPHTHKHKHTRIQKILVEKIGKRNE